MPFSKTNDQHTEAYWTRHFEDYLKPLIEECSNVRAIRSEALRGDILKQIVTDLMTAPVVVANLTDANPNVYWELGIRQSFKHGTITIAEEGTRIPFNLSMKGHLFYYPNDQIKDAEFRTRFKTAISDCIEHPEKPDSYILETITGRGSLFEIFREDESRRRVKALISENEHNKTVLNQIYDLIEENKGKEHDKKQCVFSRMQPYAIQLLVTNRYLDKDDAFYGIFTGLLNSVAIVNNGLDQWRESVEPAETYFLTNKERFYKTFEFAESTLLKLSEEMHSRSPLA
jgi:hypothetical protein